MADRPKWVVGHSMLGPPPRTSFDQPRVYELGDPIEEEEIASWSNTPNGERNRDAEKANLDRLIEIGAIRKPTEEDLRRLGVLPQEQAVADVIADTPGLKEARRGSTSDRQAGDIEDSDLEQSIASMAERQVRDTEKDKEKEGTGKTVVPPSQSSQRPFQDKEKR